MSDDPRLVLGLEGEPRPMTVTAPGAPIRRRPDPSSEQLDALLFGETFALVTIEDEWAYGQALRDGYVGWAPAAALGPLAQRPTHRVAALRTYAFEHPALRASAWGPLSMNALVCVEGREGGYARVPGAGWIPEIHLQPLGVVEAEPAAVAERFLGTAYVWGGRDSLGIDCSGLVQQAFYACGRACPRDSDQQLALGAPIDRGALRRNDLVFWDGHVGLMLDPERLLHANAAHMGVAAEPLRVTVERKRAAGEGEPIAFRRL